MKKGFTLSEMMIVLAILGVIVSVGWGVWQQYSDEGMTANTPVSRQPPVQQLQCPPCVCKCE